MICRRNMQVAILRQVRYVLVMDVTPLQVDQMRSWRLYARELYRALAPRAFSVIMFGALFCNLAVKFFHAVRSGLLGRYPGWIFTDIAVLLTIEVGLALTCYRWPMKRVVRGATIFAAVICTWSVMNAGWLIRTGTQILPMELLPLIRDPISGFGMVIKNLASMPGPAVVLLAPSAVALAFLFSVLAKPMLPSRNRRRFRVRIVASLVVAVVAVIGHFTVSNRGSAQIAAAGLRFNCQSRAVLAFLLPEYRHLARDDFNHATRELPRGSEVQVNLKPRWLNHNVVIVILEGVQYGCTSLPVAPADVLEQTDSGMVDPTPALAALAARGVSFTNMRSAVTHTTKAVFALLTGRLPSASQDIAETVPVDRPYAGLATILNKGMGFRTAFFQSAKGTFESRPGLVHNLGFDKFWAREDLGDRSRFVGYLGADEFAMLEPIRQWIQSESRSFLLVVLCSVTHDPYEVPSWFGEQPKDAADRYRQAISYTDRFIEALDIELTNLGLAEDTLFCVVADHGEAFSEHSMMSHERIAYEEVLRVPWVLRAPFLVEAGTRIASPASSVDLTPTILDLLGFDIGPMHFDGIDALGDVPRDRKVYFSDWKQQGPAGFVQQNNKYVYNPGHGSVSLHRLDIDPLELCGIELPPEQAQQLSEEIVAWRRNTIFQLDQRQTGQTMLFDSWHCKWNDRISTIKRAKTVTADPASP